MQVERPHKPLSAGHDSCIRAVANQNSNKIDEIEKKKSCTYKRHITRRAFSYIGSASTIVFALSGTRGYKVWESNSKGWKREGIRLLPLVANLYNCHSATFDSDSGVL